MSDKITIDKALEHSPNHASLVAQRFAAARVENTEFAHTYDPLSGVHRFTSESGHVEEVLSPVPEKTEEKAPADIE